MPRPSATDSDTSTRFPSAFVFQSGARSVRTAAERWSVSGWLARSLLASAGVLLVVITIVLIVPMIALGVLVAIALLIRATARRWFIGARSPNGVLDGRKNVRVIVPDQSPSA